MADEVNATKVLGLLIGFLVVGIIGTYVGDQLITGANLSVARTTDYTLTNYTHQDTAPSIYTWTVPTGVTSIDIIIVGAGGGGGSGNSTDDKGGEAGRNGSITTVSSLAVTPGTVLNIKHGKFGAGGDGTTNGDGAAGINSSITIGTTLYNALGGNGGLTSNSTNTTSGLPGLAGWRTTGSAQDGYSNKSAAGGAGGVGFGAGGGGGASASWIPIVGWSTGPWVDSSGGRGENGGTRITYSQTLGTTAGLYSSQTSIIETFQLGVTLCKIIVIVSVASIIFVLLQHTGLIPAFGAGRSGPPPS